jgi:peptidoglycan/LPS O-acetylase OafA/YrhL
MKKKIKETNITAASTKLHGLDNLRAFAILFVLLFHYGKIFKHPEWASTIGKFGWTGVDLFFVLSGFLIASQLFKKINDGLNISLKEFYIKRFFRIIPAYLVVLSLYFIFPYLREREALPSLWKFLTFTQNLNLNTHSQFTFSHVWSLCIEEQFYLLFPLLLLLFIKIKQVHRGHILLIVLSLIGLLIRMYWWNKLDTLFEDSRNFIYYWYRRIYFPTYNRLDGLLVGVAIAGIFSFKPILKNWIIKNSIYIFLASLIILTAAYFVCEDESSYEGSVWGFPLVSIGYGCMVMAAISPTSFLYKWKSKFLSWIATLSYALYLTHKIMIHVTQVEFENMGVDVKSNTMFLISMVACFVGAIVLNKIVEKPFQKIKTNIISKINLAQ